MSDDRVYGTQPGSICANFEFNNNKQTDSWDELAAFTATGTWNDDGYVAMATPAIDDRIVRQSKEYYMAKSYKYNTALFTAILNVETANTDNVAGEFGSTSRVGVFDDLSDKPETTDLGFFFEYTITDGATVTATNPLQHPLKVGVRYNSTANTLGDTLVSQDSFNVNDLNRNTHISISEWSKIYTFEIKYNAIGHVEWAIYLDGERILLHKEQDISNIIHVLPKFNMPLRFELDNTTANGNTDTAVAPPVTYEMRQFHTSMICENGTTNPCNGWNAPPIMVYHLAPLTTSELIYTIDTFSYEPIFSIRLKADYIRDPIRLYEVMYLVHKRGPFIFAIIRNGTPATASWQDPGSAYKLEYDVSSSSIGSTADCIHEEYVDANGGGVDHKQSKFELCLPPITSSIDGTPDEFTIVARKMSVLKVTSHWQFRWTQD